MADNVKVTDEPDEVRANFRSATIPSGGSVTVYYYIEATAGRNDPQGCNASDDTPATLTFYVESTQLGSGTTPVAASPDSLRFTACKDGNNLNSQSVTFSSSTPGSYVITVQVTGQGSYNTTNATFTLVVEPTETPTPTPSDITPPEITCQLPDRNSWYRYNVTVECTASDEPSGLADPENDASFTLRTSVDAGEERDDAETDWREVCDQAGNCAEAGPYIFKVDRKAPVVNCAPPDKGVWYANDVSVRCTARDDGSGLADPADADFTLSTNVPEEQETENATTGSRTVRDAVGNETTVGPYTFKVDRKAPEVTLSCPSEQILQNTSDVVATWRATDGGSGVAGDDSGEIALDTSQVGTQTATLPAGSVRDRVGNQSEAANCNYSVIYRWSGFFRPVDNPTVWNVVKAGSAVPVKFSLAGFQEMDILSGTPKVVWVPCTNGASDQIDEASTAGNSGLHYDATTDQYIYVWKTDRNWAGNCAKLVVTLKDGTSHEAWFRFTK
jgi:archaellum component FlaG (FlaF/FlaG flagellin family)